MTSELVQISPVSSHLISIFAILYIQDIALKKNGLCYVWSCFITSSWEIHISELHTYIYVTAHESAK